jgi:hypothetical protein
MLSSSRASALLAAHRCLGDFDAAFEPWQAEGQNM